MTKKKLKATPVVEADKPTATGTSEEETPGVERPKEPDEKEHSVAGQSEPESTTEPPPIMTGVLKDIEQLKLSVINLSMQLADLRSTLTVKRTPMPNGKAQIRDKTTGKTYKSKNNAYQTMLKAGELKDLVDKGVFGADPAKNNFGWFALNRAWPDRFEEVKPDGEQPEPKPQPESTPVESGEVPA